MNEFVWDPVALRYRGPGGRFVSRVDVRRSIDAALRKAERRMKIMTEKLRSGKISISAWEAGMREQIKNVHLYNAANAKGGWAQMTQADYGRVGQVVRRQYKYLDRFAQQMTTGKIPSDGKILSRATSYAQAGRGTYHKVDREVHRRAGFTEERNLISAGENCGGCLNEQGRGWVEIGELVPIGSRTCLTRCQCSIEFRRN